MIHGAATETPGIDPSWLDLLSDYELRLAWQTNWSTIDAQVRARGA